IVNDRRDDWMEISIQSSLGIVAADGTAALPFQLVKGATNKNLSIQLFSQAQNREFVIKTGRTETLKLRIERSVRIEARNPFSRLSADFLEVSTDENLVIGLNEQSAHGAVESRTERAVGSAIRLE